MNLNTVGAVALPPEEANFNKLLYGILISQHSMQEVLKKVRKKQIDPPLTSCHVDGAQAVRDVSHVKNGIKKELSNGMSQYEIDCDMLSEVIFKMNVHTQPSKSGGLCLLVEFNIKPHSRKFHDSLQSPILNKILHLLQNAISQEFYHPITIAQDAFKAPEQDVSLIYVLGKLSGENFPLEKCHQLCYKLEAESHFGDQFKEFSGNSMETKPENENETCTPNIQCSSNERFNKSLISVGWTLSLNWIPISSSIVRAMADYPLRRSPSVSEEAFIESTENTYQEEYASARPLSDSSTKLQTDFDEMSGNEGDLLSREDSYDTKTVVVNDSIEHNYHEFKQSERLNCTCPCCQKNSVVVSQLQRSNDTINASNSKLQDDIAAYQDRCSKQEDEISQLKEKLTQMEEEKQRLEAEVGRQLFFESKERRRKLLNKHSHEQSMLGTTREASYEGELLHEAGSMDRSEQVTTWCNENGALSEGDTSSCLEGNQVNEVPESSYNEADEISDELEEHRESNKTTEIDEQAPICNCPIGNTFYSYGDVTLSNLNADNLPESSSIRGISNSRLSTESCGSVFSLSQSSTNSANNLQPSTGDSNLCSITTPLNFDQAVKAWESSGEDNQERYLLSFLENKQFENEEMKGGCAAKGEREREDLDSYNSFCDGDLVDGSVSIPNRTQSSLKLVEVDVANVNQGPFAHRDTTRKQNLSVVRVTDQIDTVIDQSDCHTSNQSSKWEHLGARPRDRPSKGNRSSECSSLCFSSLDPVPQQVAGVANAFLARHSEDKHLHESLYYTYAEEMLAKDFSSQGACDSHVEGITNSNKEKLYLGDFQVTSRPDPPYYPPYSSVFPLTVGASIRGNGEDGNPYHNTLNGNSVLLPGPLYSYIGGNTDTNSNFNSFDPNFLASDIKEPRLLQHDQFSSLCSSDILQSGFTGSRLTPDFLGTTGPQMTHSVIGIQSNIGFTRTTSALPLEPLQMQTPSTSNLGLLATSTSNTQCYSHQPNASTDFQTLSSVAMANQSDSRFLSELEFDGNTHLSPVSSSSIRDGVNISGRRNLSSILNTIGDHLASGTYREGNSSGNSSSSCITSGANTGGDHDENSAQSGGSIPNENYGTESVESTDNSLLELEQHVEEACAMVERVLREREEREEFGREIERKEREIRAERARKKREREARELEEARGWPQQQEPVTGQSLWLCEHYQRHCRVRFPCCTNFYSCHRCHNNSKECDNEEAKASHATHLKCSYCHHEQEIAEDSAKCRSCGAKMSAYFCGICKHFTSIDKNPYHCDKCGICRIHKDKSFHCDVCNVCLDKRLQGKHKCRPDSGHDECCICLEDAFSGCQILPCSHKVHRECAIAMIQNGIRTCPVCRHPLYSPAPR